MSDELSDASERPLSTPTNEVPDVVPAQRAGSATLLARAASGSFGLNVINTGATVVIAVVLARNMTVADFGVYSWVVAMVTLLSVPAVLGADRLLIRDVAVYASRGAYGYARGLVRRSAQLVLASALLLAGFAGAVAWLSEGAVTPTLWAFLIGMISLPLLALARVAQSVLMGLQRVVLAQLPEYVLRPLLFLALVGLTVVLAGGPLDAPLAVGLYAVSLGATLLAGALLLLRWAPSGIKVATERYETRRWTLAAVSLTLLSGAAVVNQQTGVVLLGALDGPEPAGLYAVAQRGAMLIGFPLIAVNTALAPVAARLWATADVSRLQRLATLGAWGALAGALPVAVAFIVAGEAILDFFFGTPFAAAAGALAILALGQLANAGTGPVTTLLVMSGNQRRAVVGVASGALLNVGVALALIPTLGIAGAAVAGASSLVLSNLILVYLARRILGVNSTALSRLRS